MKLLSFYCYSFLIILSLSSSYADDSSAEIVAGGLQFKPIKKISVEREDLYLNDKKITVSMKFKNNSDKDINTIVAFPIPEYRFSYMQGIPDFKDFSVEVDGHKVNCQIEARAFIEGKEYTKILRKMNISIQDFAGFNESKDSLSYFANLSKENQRLLIESGIVDTVSVPGEPCWTVKLKYYWTQKFSANKSVTITHRYSPYCGFQFYSNNAKDRASLKRIACLNKEVVNRIKSFDDNLIGVRWMSYVLKSALNWGQPMKVFHLVVEKPDQTLFSTCFSHHFTQKDEKTYELTIDNFVPDSDIRIYFVDIPNKDKKIDPWFH